MKRCPIAGKITGLIGIIAVLFKQKLVHIHVGVCLPLFATTLCVWEIWSGSNNAVYTCTCITYFTRWQKKIQLKKNTFWNRLITINRTLLIISQYNIFPMLYLPFKFESETISLFLQSDSSSDKIIYAVISFTPSKFHNCYFIKLQLSWVDQDFKEGWWPVTICSKHKLSPKINKRVWNSRLIFQQNSVISSPVHSVMLCTLPLSPVPCACCSQYPLHCICVYICFLCFFFWCGVWGGGGICVPWICNVCTHHVMVLHCLHHIFL